MGENSTERKWRSRRLRVADERQKEGEEDVCEKDRLVKVGRSTREEHSWDIVGGRG